MANRTEYSGTPVVRNHTPKVMTASAVATAAKSRNAVRRPLAMAIDPRPAKDEGDHATAYGVSSAGNNVCAHGASAGEKT